MINPTLGADVRCIALVVPDVYWFGIKTFLKTLMYSLCVNLCYPWTARH